MTTLRSRASTVLLALALVPLVGAGCRRDATPPAAPSPPAPSPPPAQGATSPPPKEAIPPEAETGRAAARAAVRATRHMAVAANPHAARAGQAMLQAGGSAVDAAIAMQMVLNLVEPQSSGIGGGAFLLHQDPATGSVEAYDGRETAPRAARPDQFLGPDHKPLAFFDAIAGGRAVGVPGVLRMLELAHREHGKLPWARLFEPAIRLATEGFQVSPRLFQLVALEPRMRTVPALRAMFLGPDGQPKPVGTVLRNPAYAETLRAVAAGGADAFYTGEIARDMVAAVKSAPNPGALSLEDLAGYRARKRPPVCAPYRRFRVCGMPPPTSGGVTLLQILGILERFDLGHLRPESPEAAHLLAEAMRLAYADRDIWLADPDFAPVPVERLLARDYLARRAARVDPKRAMGRATPGDLGIQGGFAPNASAQRPSTSHLVAVDDAGRWVSMTTSIEAAFGSGVFVRGFLLNNQLTDFSFLPMRDGKPVRNRLEPGKRPRSSMAPTLVLEGDHVRLALGSPGGGRIITFVAQAVVAVLDWNLDVQAAVALPHVTTLGGPTELERVPGREGPTAEVRAGLERLGHRVQVIDLNSGLHAIERRADGLYGGADPRREGVALGD